MFALLRQGRQSIVPLLLTVFIDLLGIGIAIPVLAVIFLDPQTHMLPAGLSVGMRTFIYGLLIGSYPLAQFFGAPILGALSDHHGRKPLLVISLIGTAIGYALFAIGILIQSPITLFLSRILAGFMGGNLSIALSGIVDLSDPKSKTHNFGLVGMAFGLGFILGPFFGGKLADPSVVSWFNLATPFWFAGGVTVLNILLCALFFRESIRKRLTTKISVFTGFRNIAVAFTLPKLRLMFSVIFLTTLGFNLFTQFFQIFLIDKFGFTQGRIGEFLAYTGLWIAATQGLLLRPITRNFTSRTIFSISTLLLSLSIPALLLPRQPGWLYVVVPLLAVFYGLSQPVSTTIVSDLSGEESQGEILGINQSVQSLAMAIPAILGGLVAGVHIYFPILAACFITFIGWALFALFFPRTETRKLFHEI